MVGVPRHLSNLDPTLLDRVGSYEARLWRQAGTLEGMRQPPPPMRQRLRHRAALFSWERLGIVPMACETWAGEFRYRAIWERWYAKRADWRNRPPLRRDHPGMDNGASLVRDESSPHGN